MLTRKTFLELRKRFFLSNYLPLTGILFIIILITFTLSPTSAITVDPPDEILYPPAGMDDTVDDYHGTEVKDPYRWLEDADSEETIQWTEMENELTESFISSNQDRENIKERLTGLWNYPKYSVPTKKEERYFFYKNDGLQNQSVLYMQKDLKGEALTVLNPNEFSEDGTVSLNRTSISKDGTLIAYGISESGSDWQEIKIRNIDTGKDYEEVIKWSRGGGIAWKHDNSGFYYDRYPEPGTVPEEDETKYKKVYYHKLGTPQSEDILVYERPDNKELSFYPFITDDGKYLVLIVYEGTNPKNRIYYREVESNGDFVRLLDEGDADYSFIDSIEDVFYFRTDLDTPKGRIIAIDLKRPERENWKEIVPEGEDTLYFVTAINNQLVAGYLHDARYELKLYDISGNYLRDIELPGIGSIGSISGERKDSEMFFTFTSFLYPTSIFHYDFKGEELSLFHGSEIDFDPSGYETKQVFYNSKDGTAVPMFITHKKGLELKGDNPVILYGYGGFNSGMTPFFSISNVLWLEQGGVYCVANIRGGDEYGEDWHRGGMLEKKQNCFDDFIAAAEWLISKGYTKPEKLAIDGASNGGLLVAACMVQRPELFGAVICEVPLTDMLRYHKLKVGHYWTTEYGNPEEDPEAFKYLYAYSPLHNVKESVIYPPTLILTADHDDRVDPSHAKKFAATLQMKDGGNNPILIRIETKAGHGGGKPTAKVINEQTDIYAFLFKIFDMNFIE